MTRDRLFVLTLCALLATSICRAMDFPEEPYSFQVGLTGSFEDSDSSSSSIYGLLVGGAYPKVEPRDEPVAEGLFAQRVGTLNGLVGILTFSFDVFGDDLDFDSNVFGAQLRVAHRQSPIALDLNFFFIDMDDEDGLSQFDFGPGPGILPATVGIKQEIQSFGGTLWAYVTPTAALGVEFVMETAESTISIDSVPPGNLIAFTGDTDETTIGLQGKYLFPVGNGMWVNVEGGARMFDAEDNTGGSPDEENHEFFAVGDFYFNRFISLGAGVTVNNGDDKGDKGATYLGRVRFNYGSRFGAELTFEQFDVGDDSQGDEDSTSFGLQAFLRL